MLLSLLSACFLALYGVGKSVCSLETLVILARPHLFIWENSWDLTAFLINPQYFFHTEMSQTPDKTVTTGGQEFPRAAKCFHISKALLSCSLGHLLFFPGPILYMLCTKGSCYLKQ